MSHRYPVDTVPDRSPRGERSLDSLFDPASVVIVGASNDEQKWGHWLAKGALRGAARRRVHLVNRRADQVLGQRAYPSVAEVPGGAELAVICVPAPHFEQAVNDGLEGGARAIIGISAGLGEASSEGARLEQQIAARVRDAGCVLLGPNCLGLLDHPSALYLTSNDLPDGPIGLISQSGNLALELGAKAARAGLGFARFASLGNQADLDVADLVADFAAAPHIEAIALYCEDFRDGRRFLEAADAARQAGKPVVLLAVGSSAAAVRAARSHTGAMVSGGRSVDAACRAAGIERVSTPEEMIDMLAGLLLRVVPASSRVGILADGGGHGAVAADVVTEAGLEVPAFSETLTGRIAELTRTPGATSNPVDLAGAGEQDVWSFAHVLDAMLSSGDVDSVLVTGYFGGYTQYSAQLAADELAVAEAIVTLAQQSKRPLVVHTMHEGDDFSDALRRLQSGGIPVYTRIEAAATVLARLERSASRPPNGIPPVPQPVPLPVGAESGYLGARSLLASAGIDFASALAVDSVEAAVDAADAIGYPVVLKAPGIEHKSDAGGVALGLHDAAAVSAAAGQMWAHLGDGALSVESMLDLSAGVEILVGSVRDHRFGPVVAVGLGGIYAEVMDDVAASLAPVTEAEALRLLSSLKAAPLLFGARGRPALDVAAAARAIAALSEVAARHPAIAEIEINPLLVLPQGAVGLDARIVLSATA